ncbi:MAG: hypothetical protein N2322_05580 [Terrimicrobiaceae bacterium]|nr:hypothetical protein [Terrimicrobiaceae bacterium]
MRLLQRQRRPLAATLAELCVAAGVVAILAALALPTLGVMRDRSDEARCAAAMRQIGAAVLATAAENGGRLPRSNHSAAAHGERGWLREILPALGLARDLPAAEYRRALERHFRCPADRARKTGSSFGLNVYFELDPEWDDYPGSPQTWRTLASLPRPSRTILLAEVPAAAEHVMAHFWGEGGYGGDVASTRHRGKSHFLFADGHLERLSLAETFGPEANLWHPALAR